MERLFLFTFTFDFTRYLFKFHTLNAMNIQEYFVKTLLYYVKEKKSSESNLYLRKSEKKIVVTSTRVILRKTDFFRFSPRNS